MNSELRKAVGGIVAPSLAPTSPPHRALSDEDVSILKSLSDADDPGVNAEQLAEHFKMKQTKMTYLLNRLEKEIYLYGALFIGE